MSFHFPFTFSGTIKFTTLFGGASADVATAVALYYSATSNGVPTAAASLIFIGGSTLSNGTIPTINPIQNYSGDQDCVIAAYRPNGSF